MTKRVQVGKELDLDVEIVEAQAKVADSKVRSVIALGVMVLCAVFVCGAAMLGVLDRSFDELQNVWIVIGPIAGAVLTYYFGGSDGKKGSNSGSG